jgi:hydroxymethylglutaryl-CoA lyase
VTASDVCIYEVGPRDGLQNEPETVPTDAKLALVRRLAAAGLRRIEVTSFVSPKWIPQLADGEALAAALPELPASFAQRAEGERRPEGVRFSALVPNEQGYARFRSSRTIEMAAVFISASETHNRKNVNCSIAEQLERFRPVAERARADGVALRAYVSTVCGCPYEGAVAVGAVTSLVGNLRALGVEEISLGDTIGVGVPRGVRELVAAVAGVAPLASVALHLHDTYGRALANVAAGYEAGVRTFDSSLGGLGGCPYAPGASGNVATEDVVDLFERSGIATGVSLDALVDASAWLEDEVLSRPLPGRVYRAVRGARQASRSEPQASEVHKGGVEVTTR